MVRGRVEVVEIVVVFAVCYMIIRWMGAGAFHRGAPSIGAAPVEDEACLRLRDWLETEGGEITNVACAIMPKSGGRGIMVTGPLAYKETYIRVPVHTWMHETTIKANSTIGSMLDTDPKISEVCGKTWGANGEPCRLILAVVYERLQGRNSKWAAYMDSWPEHPTSPVWWDEEQLAKLGSPVVADQVEGLQEYLSNTYDSIFPYLHKKYPKQYPAGKATLEMLTWAALNVWGRAFDSSAQDPVKKDRRTWAMIPFADLVNHGSHIESFYGDSNGKGPFKCWATQCMTEGSEILQSYGSHRSSTHFFLYYGFISTGYLRADYISLRVADDVRRKASKSRHLPSRNSLVGHMGVDGLLTESFLYSYTKLLNLTGSIPADDLKETKGLKTALSVILKTLDTTIASFDTTYAQDFAELAKPFETYDKWVTLTFRSRYKFVFIKAREGIQYRLSQLETEPSCKLIRVDKKYRAQDPGEGCVGKKASWQLVYDTDEVKPTSAEANAKDALFLVHLPADAKVLA